ncbi:hypothetical protein DENSPDRAFT_515657 [Dentipellis sp. KUC8613]|nr:hypothetical protein DENSPDRAFT_515657 [Dentipellis sp. KUC8613]
MVSLLVDDTFDSRQRHRWPSFRVNFASYCCHIMYDKENMRSRTDSEVHEAQAFLKHRTKYVRSLTRTDCHPPVGVRPGHTGPTTRSLFYSLSRPANHPSMHEDRSRSASSALDRMRTRRDLEWTSDAELRPVDPIDKRSMRNPSFIRRKFPVRIRRLGQKGGNDGRSTAGHAQNGQRRAGTRAMPDGEMPEIRVHKPAGGQ